MLGRAWRGDTSRPCTAGPWPAARGGRRRTEPTAVDAHGRRGAVRRGQGVRDLRPGPLRTPARLRRADVGQPAAPAWAAPVLALACFAPDLRPGGVALYKTVFNVANYTLVGVLVRSRRTGTGRPVTCIAAVAGAVANHGLIVVAIALAGEQPLRGTLRQLTDGLPLSVGVGLTGAVLAVLWVGALPAGARRRPDRPAPPRPVGADAPAPRRHRSQDRPLPLRAHPRGARGPDRRGGARCSGASR